ncbi:meiotic recombination protein SPO11-like [Cyclospora cayetanensis]|uniref:DNA topoisomerase (ATP-hydrolyzing) n=1 Tax=Cyclospora cayetanensis TaxID=88456 RepID=A0A6P6S1D3_9EIME|nr:meiotic recombination protein SPO11-like [Cyclospora cayetanensis]
MHVRNCTVGYALSSCQRDFHVERWSSLLTSLNFSQCLITGMLAMDAFTVSKVACCARASIKYLPKNAWFRCGYIVGGPHSCNSFLDLQYKERAAFNWQQKYDEADLCDEKRTATQRELYYRAPDIFSNQQQVNVLLQDIVALLEISRASLSVFASERGSVAGLLSFRHRGHTLSCSSGSGVMISESLLEADELHSSARYIIVVEKDTIFQSLCAVEFWNLLPCILITGKGFPDFATRKLLIHLAHKLNLEAGYVGDYDPHGVQIFLTYQHGSKSFEGRLLSLPSLHWIGMLYRDTELLPPTALLQLGQRDTALLQSLLSHPGVLANKRLREECESMKKGGRKCEVEALEWKGPDYIGRHFVASRILRREWI